jgi:molecular chaperone HtpG
MVTTKENKETTMEFGAEVGKILHLMIHSLYSNKDIFLRELVSNASDACDKLRYQAITNPALTKDNPELKIEISFDKEKRILTVRDNGIGMNRTDLIENIGTIARSGTQKFIEQMSGDNKKDLQLIGQFGVGFYSSFMVADEIIVKSRRAGEDEIWQWQSKGEGSFTIKEHEDKGFSRGTEIMLMLKDDQDEFLDKFRIRHIIHTYSEHIPFPIELIEEDDKREVLNKASAIWMRPKSEITEEDYEEFYKHVSHSPGKPWLTIHNKNEGVVEYTNLLFIPSTKPFDLFHPDRKSRVKLYIKRVFITDEMVELVPAYLRFLRGVIDSEDLPLNISRETLQYNQVVEKIKRSVTKKIISELKKKLNEDRTSYEEFWNNFGPVLKEGLCEGLDDKSELLSICLFRSVLSNKLITLDEYVEKMKSDQDKIYYLSSDNYDAVKNSPQIEGFIKKDIDVLVLTDSVDDFWVNVQHKYKDKNLKSVTRFDEENVQNDEKNDSEKKEEESKLIAYFKEVLADKVNDVKISNRLVDSPVCLAVGEGAMDIRLERYLKEQKQLLSVSAKILEININHPIVNKIEQCLKSGDRITSEDLVNLLFDQACVIEGEQVIDSGAFAKRINKYIQMVI